MIGSQLDGQMMNAAGSTSETQNLLLQSNASQPGLALWHPQSLLGMQSMDALVACVHSALGRFSNAGFLCQTPADQEVQ